MALYTLAKNQEIDAMRFLYTFLQVAAAPRKCDLYTLASFTSDPLIANDQLLENIATASGYDLTPNQMREIASNIFPSEQ